MPGGGGDLGGNARRFAHGEGKRQSHHALSLGVYCDCSEASL
jgi:hypothetical protein